MRREDKGRDGAKRAPEGRASRVGHELLNTTLPKQKSSRFQSPHEGRRERNTVKHPLRPVEEVLLEHKPIVFFF